MAVVQTYGKIEGIIKNVLMSNGATQQDPNGRFYIDGQMVGVELSRAIAEAIYLEEIFQAGFNCTAKYTTDTTFGGTIRVPLEQPFKPSSRTLSFGGRPGTPGNSGIFNMNPAILPTTDEFLIYMNQINDQDLVLPDISRQFIPLDLLTSKIKNLSQSIGMSRSSSTLAEVLAYNFYRSLNSANNIIHFDGSQQNAYANLVSLLNQYFTDGDIITGAYTFPTNGRCVIARPTFYNIFNNQSGVILNGSNMAQEMLNNYKLDTRISERNFVGQGYIGEFGGIHFVIVNDSYFTFAERYLGLADGSLSGIQAVAFQADSLAIGRAVDLGVKLQDTDSRYPRGLMARPLNLWGHEMFRKGFLIADSTFTNDTLTSLGFSADVRPYPCAPQDLDKSNQDTVNVPVLGEDGSIVAYKQIARAVTPSGDNFQSGLPIVANITASVPGGTYASTQNVTLSTTTTGATIYYTTNGDTPTTSSSQYSSPVAIAATSTLKAIAVKEGSVPSDVFEATYTINAG